MSQLVQEFFHQPLKAIWFILGAKKHPNLFFRIDLNRSLWGNPEPTSLTPQNHGPFPPKAEPPSQVKSHSKFPIVSTISTIFSIQLNHMQGKFLQKNKMTYIKPKRRKGHWHMTEAGKIWI